MIVSIHQPNYIPWGGYFHKIINSDLFIFLDDVQFSKNSFINRAKVTHNNKYTWLSIPVKFNFGESIFQVRLAQEDWQFRHLSKIHHIYGKTPYFKENWNDIENLFKSLRYLNLQDINKRIILTIAGWLNININYNFSSNFKNTLGLKAEDRIIDIVKQCKSNTYLSGLGAKKYQNENKFSLQKMKVIYSNFLEIEKKFINSKGNILPGTSILDLIFYLGRKNTISYLNKK